MLAEFLLFLAKLSSVAFIIVISFALLMALIGRARSMSSDPDDGEITITNLSDEFNDIDTLLEEETYDEDVVKALAKRRKKEKKLEKKTSKKIDLENLDSRLFVLRFDGDIEASEVSELRESVTAILLTATERDEVLVILESAGGYVHQYGLAASQLQRLRMKHIPLTVAIDAVAASGGYLMACVANKILAAPFALVGSIGVIAEIPNFARLLKKHNVDYEQHSAGEYKRTITMFGEITDKERSKFKEELNDTHELFKTYVARHRSSVDIDVVSTGEYWHGTQAKHLNLVDDIMTSDDYLLQAHEEDRSIYEVSYKVRRRFLDKLGDRISASVTKIKCAFPLLMP